MKTSTAMSAPRLAVIHANEAYINDPVLRTPLFVAVFGHRNISTLFSELSRRVGEDARPHVDDSTIYLYMFRSYNAESTIFGKGTQRESINAVVRRINESALTNLEILVTERIKALRRARDGDHRSIVRPMAPLRANYGKGTTEVPRKPVGVRRISHR